MNKKTILLVEDNPDDVELTKEAFRCANILNEMAIVNDGVEAMNWLNDAVDTDKNSRVLPAVVLLDLKLPKLDGFEVLRRIRADSRLRRLPVIVLTSSREQEDILKSYDLHANSFIRKPVNFEQFTEAVRQLGLYWLLLNEPPPKEGGAR